jgi:hypothetical protein
MTELTWNSQSTRSFLSTWLLLPKSLFLLLLLNVAFAFPATDAVGFQGYQNGTSTLRRPFLTLPDTSTSLKTASSKPVEASPSQTVSPTPAVSSQNREIPTQHTLSSSEPTAIYVQPTPPTSHPQPTTVQAATDLEARLNLQAFTGSLGGISAPAIILSSAKDRPFGVLNDSYSDFVSASDGACSVQLTLCLQAVNEKPGLVVKNVHSNSAFSASDCNTQKSKSQSWRMPLTE